MCKANTSYQRIRINKNKRLLREYGRINLYPHKKNQVVPTILTFHINRELYSNNATAQTEMEKVKENNEKRDFIIIAGAVVIVVCLKHWLTDDEIDDTRRRSPDDVFC